MSSLIGSTAPKFTLNTSDGEMFSLSDLNGQWKVLFFYAKDGSPTCKGDAYLSRPIGYSSLTPPVEVIGISQDTVEQRKNSRKSYNYRSPYYPILIEKLR